MFNMSSNTQHTPQETAGAVEHTETKAKRVRSPMRAVRKPGILGLARQCRGCDVEVTSDGVGRPKEYCDGCRAEVYRLRQAAYYQQNRTRLLKVLNEKRFAERMARGEQ
jgi:hypothetical protein